MPANISQAALRLLKHLRNRSDGSGQRIWLDPKPITRDLGISRDQFTEDSASLAAHGFVGVRNFRPDANDVPSTKCSAIWLTIKGEDYLRRLQLGPASRE